VNNSLVVGSNRGRVVQDHHFGLELPNRRRLQLPVDEDHTFAEVVPLERLLLDLRLDGEANRLSCVGLLHIYALVMDALHLNRIELASLVRPQEQRLVRDHRSGEHGARHDNTHTSHLIEAVNEELYGVCPQPELA